MVIINTIDDKTFSVDGISFAKIYQPLAQGSAAIGIYNVFDTSQQLKNSTDYNQYLINGVTYGSQEATIPKLLDVIYSIVSVAEFEALNNRVENLEENQYSGIVVYSTYAELPATGTILVSYKVSNDPDSSLNGYYHWSGSVYIKDASLANGVVEEGNSDATSGGTVFDFFKESSNGLSSKVVCSKSEFNDIVSELYLIGLDPTKEYRISSVAFATSPDVIHTMYIREVISDAIVSAFRVDLGVVPGSFIALAESGDSGIYGYAVVDWSKIEGQSVEVDDAIITDYCSDASFNPIATAMGFNDSLPMSSLSKAVSSDPIINNIVGELYMIGLDPSLQYKVSSIGSKYGGDESYTMYIREVVSDDIVSAFRVDLGVVPGSFIALAESGGSGIFGFAVIDWDKIEGELILGNNAFINNERASNLSNFPVINTNIKDKNNKEFTQFKATEIQSIVSSAYNYIFKHEDGLYKYSSDLGVTYKELPELSGEVIKNVNIFTNGDIMICTHQKIYYSDISFTLLTESTVLEIDGNPYVPCPYDNFSTGSSICPYTQVVNGLEMFTWGNYTIKYPISTENPGFVPRIWYTIDNGKTIKCCYRFDTSIPDNLTSPLSCRHVHTMSFYKEDESFWIPTGDEPTLEDSHVIKGLYDDVADSWTFFWQGSGNLYKTSGIQFSKGWAYIPIDQTDEGGLTKCRPHEINDESKRIRVFKTDLKPIIGFMIDDNDKFLLFPDAVNKGYVYVSNDGVNFSECRVAGLGDDDVLVDFKKPNYNGDIYINKRDTTEPHWESERNEQFNFSEMLRNGGFNFNKSGYGV